MKKVQVIICLILLSFFSQGFTPAGKNHLNEIIGMYWSPKKDAKIEIYLKGRQYCGKFVWLATPARILKIIGISLFGRTEYFERIK